MAKEVLEMEVKSNIGELSKDTQAIIEAIKGAKKETKELSKETEGVGKSSAKSVSGVKKLTGAFGGLMKSLGIVAIVASVFTALKEALERNQKAMDLMETVMSTISTTFNQIVIVLSDVVKWVTESSDRFDGLGKVLSGIVTLSLTPLKLSFYALKLGVQEVMLAWEDSFLGGGDKGKIAELREEIKLTKTNLEEVAIAAVDAGKDVVNNIGDAISEVGAIYEKAAEGVSKISVKANYEQAKATTAATKAAKFAAAEFAKLNAEKLKEAELFRQIRDDETKTFAERIQANKDLKKSLEEQQKLQSDQIQKQVTAAALAVEQNGNDENKLALMEAQNAQLELEETITGQLSEQKTNQVSLEKELAETRNEVLLAGLDGLALEIAELETAYELKKEMARKSGMDITEITEKYEKEKGDIIESYQKKVVKWSEMSSEQQLGIASSAAGDMAKILGEQTEAGKAMAVVQTTIDTFSSAQAAYKSLAGIPYVGPVLGGIAAAAAVAMGMKNIQAIKGANSSGGAGGGGSVSAPSTPAPQMMSGAFDISGGVAPEATKAYVVTDEMSNSQNQLANIRRRATI
jgi:hypothetical protein